MVANAQTEYIVVQDSLTGNYLPFAQIDAEGEILYCDENGSLSRKNVEGKKLIIRYLGYQSRVVSEIQVDRSILLVRETHSLPEVVIHGVLKPYEIGYHKFKTNSRSRGQFVHIFAVHVSSESGGGLISDIMVAFKKIYKGYTFEIFLFEVADDGSPGPLIKSDTRIAASSKSLQRFNVEEWNQQIPEKGIFVGFNWPDQPATGPPKEFPGVQITYQLSANRSYLFYKNTWHIFDYEVLGDEIGVPNFKVGLKVKPI
jgi:hypothetical protein